MNWRLGSLLSEAWLNLRSGALRSLAILAIGAAILGSLAFLELRDSDRALDLAARYVATGGYVAVADGSGGRLDAAACEALNNESHVVAAGALRSTGLVSFAQAPNTLFSRVQMTPGLVRVWAPGSAVPDAELAHALVVGPALSSELGLQRGSFTRIEDGPPLRIAEVGAVEQRNPQASRWAMEFVPPTGRAEQCWVELRPGSYEAGLAALPAWFAVGGEGASVRPYTRQDEFSRDPAAEFAGRAQRDGWIAIGLLLAGLFWLIAWFRRSELGLYMAIGTPRMAVATMQAVEGSILLGAGWLVALVYAMAIHVALDRSLDVDQAIIAARTSGSAALVALALLPLGPLILVRGSILELLKDR